MNEKAERINGWAAMIGVMAAMGSYAATGQLGVISHSSIYGSNGQLRCNRTTYPRCMVNDIMHIMMLLKILVVIAASMVGGFIFAALLTSDDVDDDDGPDGGLMTPIYAPTPS